MRAEIKYTKADHLELVRKHAESIAPASLPHVLVRDYYGDVQVFLLDDAEHAEECQKSAERAARRKADEEAKKAEPETVAATEDF